MKSPTSDTLQNPLAAGAATKALVLRQPVRYDQIDAWRGFGITIVILYHCCYWITTWGGPVGAHTPSWAAIMPTSLVYYALIPFFVASGFLITTNTIRRFGSLANIDPLAFYRTRFARIAPFLLLILLILSVFDLLHVPTFSVHPVGSTGIGSTGIVSTATLPSALLSVLTFQFNSYAATHGGVPIAWALLWSLSVEEVFYLFFPIACLVSFRLARGPWLMICVLLSFLAMGPFSRTVWHHGFILQRQAYLSCMDSIAAGCLVAMLVAWLIRSNIVISMYLLIAMEVAGNVLAIAAQLCPDHIIQKYNLVWLMNLTLTTGMCLIAFATALLMREGGRISIPLRFLGRYAYEAYLTHMLILTALSYFYLKLHRGPITLWILALLAITGAVSWFFATYYSEPLNKWLRKARRRPVSASQATQPAQV